MSEIPPEILDALNRGDLSSANLVEWLAIDHTALLRATLPALGYTAGEAARILAATTAARELGVMERCRAAGAALREASPPPRDPRWLAVSRHPSDTLRCFAVFGLQAEAALGLAARLDATRPFAADANMGVRECAWMALRPHLAADLSAAFDALAAWVRDPDANLRRCAIEATRPRGVWCAHLPALKRDPSPGLPLLEPCRADPSRYVRTSVGNWLNDASKSRPDVVRAVCDRWIRESPSPSTTWIVRHALRSLVRNSENRKF